MLSSDLITYLILVEVEVSRRQVSLCPCFSTRWDSLEHRYFIPILILLSSYKCTLYELFVLTHLKHPLYLVIKSIITKILG